ncbi:MAG: VWA domain-containing protein [Acidobacteriia bacterium]|nr:VWA domain-containing protein [Terriglobia bacterium]
MSKFRACALSAVLLAAGGRAGAQPPPSGQAPPAIKTNAEEVLVDLVVRDKKGKPIYDLKPDEIAVTDDGVRQRVTSFRLVQGKEAIANDGARKPLDPLRQIHLVTLAFEGMGVEQRQIARSAAIDMIKGDQSDDVYYSAVAIASQLQVLQSFTRDKDALRKAIEMATSGVSSAQLSSESERVKRQLDDSLRRLTGQSDTAAALHALDATPAPPPGAALGAQALEAKLVELALQMTRFDATVTDAPRLSIASLESLARGLARLPGRKSVLYFTPGLILPTYLDEPYRNLLSIANRANVTFYSIDSNGVMTSRQTANGANDLARATALSAGAATSQTGASTMEEMRAADTAENSIRNNTEGALRDLAESTGGFLIGDSNDLRTPLRRISEEIESYYEVSYSPEIQNYDGSFRRIKVEVGRKDALVHARNGYFALPPDVRAAGLMPFEIPLLQALSTRSAAADVRFRSELVRFGSTPQGIRAAVVVEAPIGGLTFRENREKGVFNAHLALVALVKNASGQVAQKFTRDMPLQGTLDKLAGVKGANFIYKETMTLPPGRYTLETAVSDRENGRLGVVRASYFLSSEPKGVALSDIALVRSYQPGANALEPSDPFQFQGGRVTPTLTRVVKAAPGAMLSLFFVVYPDASNPAKPSLEVEYLKDGKVVGKGALDLPAPDANGRIPYVMSSSAASMEPGEYVIQATAKQGASTAQEQTTIQIEK